MKRLLFIIIIIFSYKCLYAEPTYFYFGMNFGTDGARELELPEHTSLETYYCGLDAGFLCCKFMAAGLEVNYIWFMYDHGSSSGEGEKYRTDLTVLNYNLMFTIYPYFKEVRTPDATDGFIIEPREGWLVRFGVGHIQLALDSENPEYDYKYNRNEDARVHKGFAATIGLGYFFCESGTSCSSSSCCLGSHYFNFEINTRVTYARFYDPGNVNRNVYIILLYISVPRFYLM